ncbi:hypothetical protein [Methanoregula sp.]|uniref:hypothetical protein n=1 Tax=Methanoregula sp. TaxID=2052170 RepID=UPI003C1D008D
MRKLNDNFQPGIPAIELELDKADRICSTSGDDLSFSCWMNYSSHSTRTAGNSPGYGKGWSTADRLPAFRTRRSRR